MLKILVENLRIKGIEPVFTRDEDIITVKLVDKLTKDVIAEASGKVEENVLSEAIDNITDDYKEQLLIRNGLRVKI